MKKSLKIGIAILLSLMYCKVDNSSDPILLDLIDIRPPWNIYFSYPGRDTRFQKKNEVRSLINRKIRDSQSEILMYVYGLDDSSILESLRDAMDRGVRVQIRVDQNRTYRKLRELKIPYEVWRGSGLHHPKVILIDQKYLFLGTGNFTTQGLLTDYDLYLDKDLRGNEAKAFLSLFDQPLNFGYLSLDGVYFLHSPDQGKIIQKRILDRIRSAKFRIRYLIFTHFDPLISYEFLKAAQRGVKVEGIYNRPINPEGVYLSQMIQKFGGSIYEEENEDRIDNGEFGLGGLLHHKTLVVDDQYLLSGSYNFTRSARDSNKEIFFETKNTRLVEESIREFYRIRAKSKRIFPPFPESGEALSPELYGDPNSEFVLSVGEGPFRSLGFYNLGASGTRHPVSSGILAYSRSDLRNWIQSFGAWENRNLEPLEIRPQNKSSDSNSNQVRTGSISRVPERIGSRFQILSLDTRASSGPVVRIGGVETMRKNWSQLILFDRSGDLTSHPMETLDKRFGLFRILGDFSGSGEGSGLVFLPDPDGNGPSSWDAGCYRRVGTNLTPSQEFLWEEVVSQIQNPVLGNRPGKLPYPDRWESDCSEIFR
jgi:hypothetical protein